MATLPAAPAAAPTTVAYPPVPRSVEATGLPFSFLCDLVLKVLYFHGSMLGGDIARHVCLPFSLVEKTLKFLADEGYCASTGIRMASLHAGESIATGMHFLISSSGRARARELIQLNHYAGPAPVPVEAYTAVAEHQAAFDLRIDREALHTALDHLVLSDDLLGRLGPALNARQAIFLYGPPGNGKTSIAEACASLLGEPFFVPHALYVHGEVIRFFDPVHHIEVAHGLAGHDRRWKLVERPVVKAGGELLPRMLDLGFDPLLGFYEASLQLKANGGLFLVDDFGRQQHMQPSDLLNRLIVPLERGVDHLNIARAGTSIAVPFTTLLVLSTNLRPSDLMDEAFLRRVRYKVLVPDPTEDEYREIWRRECERKEVGWDRRAVDQLLDSQYRLLGRALHGVHPRDLLDHVVHAARYRGDQAVLTPATLDLACDSYFVHGAEGW
ncbi:MAG TPA: AAA family ATPase [Candidatus Dormibacteraeota bacterium]|nr:AAA family ATPase [Candidatus Dormibacteraeota bacterium]